MTTVYIPEDIIVIEILSRLPVKSLLRFKSVCRGWYEVIGSAKFIEHQNYRSASLCGRNGIGPLIFQCVNVKTLKFFLTRLRCDTLSVEEEIEIPDLSPPSNCILYWSLIGSCNGLVAVSLIPFGVFRSDRKVDRVLIWNPAIKQYLELPTPNFVRRELIDYGFGYTSSDKDYKVIRIVSLRVWGGMNGDLTINIDVYSMKSNSWRALDIESIRPIIMHSMRFMIHSSGVAFKEALHWPVLFPSEGLIPGNRRCSILSFDMVHEVFTVIQMPDAFSVPFQSSLEVLELNGFLAMAASTSSESTVVNIWVMREYGNSASWSKFMTFGEEDFNFRDISFWSGWINGEFFVLGERNNLILFEPSSRKVIKHEKGFKLDIMQAYSYHETLTPVGR